MMTDDDLYAQRMTNAEAVVLCRLAKAACPQQQFDSHTPDMWHELLKDLRFEDAKDALIDVVKRQPFVSPAEIRDAVSNVRRERIIRFGPLPQPPMEIEDNWTAYQRWMVETKRAIADGDLKPGDRLEDPRQFLDRVMPDWNKVLPAPEPVSAVTVVAEQRRTRLDPARMEQAKAELEPLRQRLVAEQAPPVTEPEAAVAVESEA
jgi:hypothetical protein